MGISQGSVMDRWESTGFNSGKADRSVSLMQNNVGDNYVGGAFRLFVCLCLFCLVWLVVFCLLVI